MSANPRIHDWAGKRVWLLGASTGIGAALAQELSARGAILTLTARDASALELLAAKCGTKTRQLPFDLTDLVAMEQAFERFDQGDLELPEIGIYLAGDYTPLSATDGTAVSSAARQMLAVNYSAAVEWSLRFSQRLLASPTDNASARLPLTGIALVASVAGYTGLPRALAYAPSKAALIRFAECLYLDLASQKLGIWLINPGFVATRLTAQNEFRMPALISGSKAAEEIIEGFASGRFEIHFPKRFTRLMKLLSALPYAVSMPLIGRFLAKARV